MEEFVHQFGIDWKLLLAQVVNFFILFYVLKKFAFSPVMNILKERKENVEKGIKLTREVEQRVESIEKEKEEVLLQAKNEAVDIINKAEIDGKKNKETIQKDAIAKAEDILSSAKKAADAKKAAAEKEAYSHVAALLKDSLVKVLGKFEPSKRDEDLINEALEELKALKD